MKKGFCFCGEYFHGNSRSLSSGLLTCLFRVFLFLYAHPSVMEARGRLYTLSKPCRISAEAAAISCGCGYKELLMWRGGSWRQKSGCCQAQCTTPQTCSYLLSVRTAGRISQAVWNRGHDEWASLFWTVGPVTDCLDTRQRSPEYRFPLQSEHLHNVRVRHNDDDDDDLCGGLWA